MPSPKFDDDVPMASRVEQSPKGGAPLTPGIVDDVVGQPVFVLLPESQDDIDARQRAKVRYPVEVATWVFLFAVAVFDLAALYVLGMYFTQLSAHVNNLRNTPGPFDLGNMTAEWTIKTAQGRIMCDVPYFNANNGSSLQKDIYALSAATQVVFWLAIVPNFAVVTYRLGHLIQLRAHTLANLKDKWQPASRPTHDRARLGYLQSNNPVGTLKIGDVTVAGVINRHERMSLRGETSAYMLIQLVQDAPLILIFFLAIAYTQRFRGLSCYECWKNAEACEIGYLISLNVELLVGGPLKVAIGACFLSILGNFVVLMCKWTWHLTTIIPKWNPFRYLTFWLVCTFSMFSAFVAPCAILFVTYLGPQYYGHETVTLGIAVTCITAAAWILGVIAFIFLLGVAAGDSIMGTLFCFNFCTFFLLAVPCCEGCLVTCAVCEGAGGCCCCC